MIYCRLLTLHKNKKSRDYHGAIEDNINSFKKHEGEAMERALE